MNRNTPVFAWILCVLVPIITIGGLSLIRRDFGRPNYQWPIQMAESPAYKAYEANPVFTGKSTLQMPPVETIPRGRKPFHFDTTEINRLRAGEMLHNPVPAGDERGLHRGKFIYDTYCLVCHGVSGAADGPIIPKYPNPPSFKSQQTMTRSDGEMFHIITMGKGNMPSYSSQVDRGDMWQTILYIRTLQK